MIAWSPLSNEPALWHSRFDVYRLLGPKRSIEETYRIVSKVQGLGGRRPGQAWYEAAVEWRWAERALAWDIAERERIRKQDGDRRLDEREYRVKIIEEMMGMVRGILQGADLSSLSVEERRELLPMARLFLRDLLREHRTELGLPDVQGGEGDEGLLPFTADELLAAQKALDSSSATGDAVLRKLPGVSMDMAPMGVTPADAAQTLYVSNLRNILCLLYPDEISARRVAAQAGLAVARIWFGARAVDTWQSILDEARVTDRMESLIRVVSGEYQVNRELRAAVESYRESDADED